MQDVVFLVMEVGFTNPPRILQNVTISLKTLKFLSQRADIHHSSENMKVQLCR